MNRRNSRDGEDEIEKEKVRTRQVNKSNMEMAEMSVNNAKNRLQVIKKEIKNHRKALFKLKRNPEENKDEIEFEEQDMANEVKEHDKLEKEIKNKETQNELKYIILSDDEDDEVERAGKCQSLIQ